MLRLFTGKRTVEDHAASVYARIVARARHPGFYEHLGVADTLDGRFEMLVLHAAMFLGRLRRAGADELAQAVVDLMFADMDQALRELGVSDVSVAKKIRPMAEAYAGRAAAYESALAPGASPESLEEAIARNVYPGTGEAGEQTRALAGYVRRLAAALEAMETGDIAGGEVSWPEPVQVAP